MRRSDLALDLVLTALFSAIQGAAEEVGRFWAQRALGIVVVEHPQRKGSGSEEPQ